MTPPPYPSPRSPLGAPHAGWGPPPRGVFVDLMGTLIEPTGPDGGFPPFGEVRFYEGVLDALFHVTQAGWNLYLIGNIETVAFGTQKASEWAEFKEALHGHLRSQGIRLARDYTCIDHPEGVKGRNRDSVYLLPGTGAMHHAAQADGVSLPLCWVVGDSTVELVAGWRAGCRIASVRTGVALGDRTFHVDPELDGRSAGEILRTVARDMTMLRRSA